MLVVEPFVLNGYFLLLGGEPDSMDAGLGLIVHHRPDAAPDDALLFNDTSGSLHNRYGARHECLYLIRPDGFIGYRSQPVVPNDFSLYLSHVFN